MLVTFRFKFFDQKSKTKSIVCSFFFYSIFVVVASFIACLVWSKLYDCFVYSFQVQDETIWILWTEDRTVIGKDFQQAHLYLVNLCVLKWVLFDRELLLFSVHGELNINLENKVYNLTISKWTATTFSFVLC